MRSVDNEVIQLKSVITNHLFVWLESVLVATEPDLFFCLLATKYKCKITLGFYYSTATKPILNSV